jgi:hypothetical protein
MNEEQLPPNYAPFIHALRNVGYSFEESVADLVDNSIDAKASKVRIRFLVRNSKTVDLLISDNGDGMDEQKLREAMRFGTQSLVEQEERLGMFGLGLKLASIAHAENLYVISLKNENFVGRAWTDEGLKKGFYCSVLSLSELKEVCALSSLPDPDGKGTWVLWRNLFRYSARFEEAEQLCEELLKSVREHLGLHLHRFLSRVDISLDILDQKFNCGPPRKVEALDPFGYGDSFLKDYPVELVAAGDYAGSMEIIAHIWPPNSASKEYKLPGGAIKRQGLFFYRNNRLLAGGGWYGIKDGLDAHDSLGRVEIHLKKNVERETSVDVRKAMVKLTPNMREAIAQSKSRDGLTFRRYLSDVNKAYRKKVQSDPKSSPLIPQGGYPSELTEGLKRLLDQHKTGDLRPMDFEWVEFHDDEPIFFDINRQESKCYLNARYRPLFCRSDRNRKNDAVLVKTLLFLLLKDTLDKERLSEKQEKWLNELNRMMSLSGNFELKQIS